ncbi:MAG: hypothetical protein ACRD1F_06355 [Terriglobales bacterium]
MLQPLRRVQVAATARKVMREMQGKTFPYRGQQLPYAIFEEHFTYGNERCIEVAIGKRFLDTHSDVLEIGNVLSRFYPVTHPVVDKYEVAKGVRNEDVLDFREGHRNILAISTLEHIGLDEPGDGDHTKFLRAVANLKSLAGETLLFTVPWGYNPSVDAFIRSFTRTSANAMILYYRAGHEWRQGTLEEIAPRTYHSRYWYANAIAVVEVSKSC